MADKILALKDIEELKKWIIDCAERIDTNEETATAAKIDEQFSRVLTGLSCMHRDIIELSEAEKGVKE